MTSSTGPRMWSATDARPCGAPSRTTTGLDTSAREMDHLKSALDDLTAKVNRLVALQADPRKPTQ